MTYHPSTIRRHRKAWLAELRSGTRQQVKGYLSCPVEDGEEGEVGFCCLGVATDMAKVPRNEYRYKDGLQYVQYGSDNEYLTLPHEARDWLGVTVGDPFLAFDSSDEDWSFLQGVLDDEVYADICAAVKHEGGDLTGALLNDKGATFAQIADLIEHFGFAAQHDVLKGAA